VFGSAVLVDTLITYDQVDALADWIETKGRRLSRIYITHGHGDHWLGLARLTQRFPGAIGLATAEVLAQAADPGMARYWEALFPGEIPGAGEKVLPRLLAAGPLDLEGNELRVIRIGQADTAHSTVLHVPSLATAVTGDLAYNQVHMMTAETGEPEREQWIANLDAVAALEPAVVIAGHKKISIPAGKTSARSGIPREEPPPARTASGLSPDGSGAAAERRRPMPVP
jgi:glyoxylase-like metal-dependent hydrolase (beta-lactamase superfamily II)